MKFEQRAVAFIDVLGFKALVCGAEEDVAAMEALRELIAVLSSAVPNFDARVSRTVPQRLVPTHTYISDSIILSAPLSDEDLPWYSGLSVVVMRCIQLTHHFLDAGYLIRGGIAVGSVWHTDGNIVGRAYQEAYELERQAGHPFVLLAPSACSGRNAASRMCIEFEGRTHVNGLFDVYIPRNTTHGVIEATYRKYRALAKRNLDSDLPQSAKDKWAWFADYLAREAPSGTFAESGH